MSDNSNNTIANVFLASFIVAAVGVIGLIGTIDITWDDDSSSPIAVPQDLQKYTDAFNKVVDGYVNTVTTEVQDATDCTKLGARVGIYMTKMYADLNDIARSVERTYIDNVRISILYHFFKNIHSHVNSAQCNMDNLGNFLASNAQMAKRDYAHKIVNEQELRKEVIRKFNKDVDVHVVRINATSSKTERNEYVARELEWLDDHPLGKMEPDTRVGLMGFNIIRDFLKFAQHSTWSESNINEYANDIKKQFANYVIREQIHTSDI